MTIQKLIELCRRAIAGGDPHDNDAVRNAEIREKIGTTGARLMAADYKNILSEGETIPPGYMIATYRNIPLAAGDGTRVYARVPVTPMSIPPNNIGVFAVYPSGYPDLYFIPVPDGTVEIIKRDKMVSNVHRKLYTYSGGRVTIEDDLIGAGITSVDMKLCVKDINDFPDNEEIPFPPEVIEQIMTEVVAFYNHKLTQNAA